MNIWSIIYRFYLININRKKLKWYLTNRKGNCKKCGMCCELDGCPALDKTTRLCKLWNKNMSVLGCKDYPLTPRAVRKLKCNAFICGYYWEEK